MGIITKGSVGGIPVVGVVSDRRRRWRRLPAGLLSLGLPVLLLTCLVRPDLWVRRLVEAFYLKCRHLLRF